MMKTMMKIGLLLAITMLISGCGGGGSSTKNEIVKYGTIKFIDGSIFGFTKKEKPIDGRFGIYNEAMIDLLGWIRMDGLVIDIDGINLGVASGVTISDNGVYGVGSVPVLPSYKVPSVGGECTPQEYEVWDFTRELALKNCLMTSSSSLCNFYLKENYPPCVHIEY